jgi:hypothetical protein
MEGFMAARQSRAADHAPVSSIGRALIAIRSRYDTLSESAFFVREPEVGARALGQCDEDGVLECDCLSSVVDEAGHCDDSGDVDSVEEV